MGSCNYLCEETRLIVKSRPRRKEENKNNQHLNENDVPPNNNKWCMQNICSNPAERCIESLHLHVFSLYLMCTQGLVCRFLAPIFQAACYNIRNSLLFLFHIIYYSICLWSFYCSICACQWTKEVCESIEWCYYACIPFFCLMVTYTIIRNESIRQYTD